MNQREMKQNRSTEEEAFPKYCGYYRNPTGRDESGRRDAGRSNTDTVSDIRTIPDAGIGRR